MTFVSFAKRRLAVLLILLAGICLVVVANQPGSGSGPATSFQTSQSSSKRAASTPHVPFGNLQGVSGNSFGSASSGSGASSSGTTTPIVYPPVNSSPAYTCPSCPANGSASSAPQGIMCPDYCVAPTPNPSPSPQPSPSPSPNPPSQPVCGCGTSTYHAHEACPMYCYMSAN